MITALPVLYALASGLGHAPFPINETVGILADVGVMSDTSASPHSLLDPTLVAFFNPLSRSWYRPFYWATWYGFWHSTHSLHATVLLFRLLEVVTTMLLVGGFLWQLRVRTRLDYAAGLFAMAVLIGMPGFRENLEIPLPMTLVGMLMATCVWMLLEREHHPWHGPALVILTVIAVGYKEQGLVLVPIIVGAWWAGAPGVRRKTAITIVVLTLAYLAMRFGTAGSWRPFEQDVGLGFGVVSASDAGARFGAFPYWIYLYSAGATVANILFSEPTDGVFRFLRDGIQGELPPWAINHLVTSIVTSALLVWWGVRTWRGKAAGQWTPESRLLLALVLSLAASGALGFNYSRDRLGGMAVVFYALASYSALREMGARLGRASWLPLAVVGVALTLLSGGWQLRAIGTIDSVDARSKRSYREWIATRQHERAAHASQAPWLRILAAMETQGLAPRPEPPTASEAWQRYLGTR